MAFNLVQNPTYILSPNWTFKPGGPIALGNVITDPSQPHRVLKKAPGDPAVLPAVQRATETNWCRERSLELSLSAGVLAQFMELVGLRIGGARGTEATVTYEARELETVYYEEAPGPAFARELVRDPAVRDTMRLDNPFSRPVYVVTGLKIARGFVLSAWKASSVSGGLGASGPVVPGLPVAVGGEVDVGVRKGDGLGFESANDIIFAYQLVRIAPRGWKEKTFKVKDYAPAAAFLGDGDDGGKEGEREEMELELDFLDTQDLEDPGIGFSRAEVSDGSVQCSCIAFEDEDEEEDG